MSPLMYIVWNDKYPFVSEIIHCAGVYATIDHTKRKPAAQRTNTLADFIITVAGIDISPKLA